MIACFLLGILYCNRGYTIINITLFYIKNANSLRTTLCIYMHISAYILDPQYSTVQDT